MDDLKHLRDLGRSLEHTPPPLSAPEFTGRVRRLPSPRGWPALAVAAAATAAIITVPTVLWSGGEGASSPPASAPSANPAVTATTAETDDMTAVPVPSEIHDLLEAATDPASWPAEKSAKGPLTVTYAQTADGCVLGSPPDPTGKLCDSSDAALPSPKDPSGVWVVRKGPQRAAPEFEGKGDGTSVEDVIEELKELAIDIEKGGSGKDGLVEVQFRRIQQILAATLRPEEGRRKLIDALGALPGVKTTENATDWIGRSATSFGIDGSDGVLREIFVDPETAHYLGLRETKGQKVTDGSAVLDLAPPA
ncbi:hypothetical protein EDD29_7895 [Actinocorallia herbida]|uniref:Uncharacterized protein n=1 Tax=Actinocorallia herbida TaxID=58109 RepID=A0A3N1D9F8_9ACTN|nr:hypothetical protein [Actinocorallia herbida]ROO90177.1 hypothetical protein EDD29_7895 [Actinocorallia herbida]